MCLQPISQTVKETNSPGSFKFPQFFAPGYGQEQGGLGANRLASQPEPSADPMTRWLRETPGTEPWHRFNAPAYSGQKDVSQPKNRPTTLSCTAPRQEEKKGGSRFVEPCFDNTVVRKTA